MVLLSIIILSYNTKDLTLACLKSIIENYKNELEKGEFEIIVADNNSTDGSADKLSTFNPDSIGVNSQLSTLKLIKNKENFGFSKGNNLAAQKARGKYLFFLNSDTEVLDKGLVEMVDFMEKNQNVGILGARLVNIDGSNQKSAGKFFNLENVFLMLFGGDRLGFLRFSPKKIQVVDWVMGASLMIQSDLFKINNGFDEKIFMYMEDMELCYRIRKNGYKTYFYPKIGIVHKEIGSSNRSFAIINIYKSLVYFYKKHKKSQLFFVKLMLFAKAHFSILIGMMNGNSNLTNTYKNALKF